MAGSLNFRMLSSKEQLHRSVSQLRRLTDTSSEDHYYRNVTSPEPGDHVLFFADELHVADGSGFLDHRDEDVGHVSMVTVQENSDGLVALLASNEGAMGSSLPRLYVFLESRMHPNADSRYKC